ncbi:MAG: Ig domain-containing protein [Microcoleaceae cyanobacterium]
MKKFLMFIVMVCLVILLGFPKPVSASNLDYAYSSIERNHQAIGRAIPGLHTLKPIPYNTYDDCKGTLWFSDETILRKYIPRSGTGPCSSSQMLRWYTYPYKNGHRVISPIFDDSFDSSVGSLRNTYVNQMKGLIRETGDSRYEKKYLGSYFAQQYPEFAIFGASELRKNFRYVNKIELNPDYYSGTTKGQKLTVDGTTAVVWEQQIPSTGSNALPTVHHLLIVENSSISDIDLIPEPNRYFQKNANYQYNRGYPTHFVRDRIRDRHSNKISDEVSLFDSFYYLIFASDAPLTQNIIENVVHSITTGTAPAPYSPSPTVNYNFSFPTLKVGQTTNLPIDVSTAFNPSVNSWTYKVSDFQLPSGLTFDSTTKSIIVDPSALPPPGPKSSGSFSVDIAVDDNNGNTPSHSFTLTVNP